MITLKHNEYQLQQFEFKIGKRLDKGEDSKSKLYGLVSKNGDYVLRISLIKEISELHCDEQTRYLTEIWANPI